MADPCFKKNVLVCGSCSALYWTAEKKIQFRKKINCAHLISKYRNVYCRLRSKFCCLVELKHRLFLDSNYQRLEKEEGEGFFSELGMWCVQGRAQTFPSCAERSDLTCASVRSNLLQQRKIPSSQLTKKIIILTWTNK